MPTHSPQARTCTHTTHPRLPTRLRLSPARTTTRGLSAPTALWWPLVGASWAPVVCVCANDVCVNDVWRLTSYMYSCKDGTPQRHRFSASPCVCMCACVRCYRVCALNRRRGVTTPHHRALSISKRMNEMKEMQRLTVDGLMYTSHRVQEVCSVVWCGVVVCSVM